MEMNTRRGFFGKIAAMAAVIAGTPKLFALQAPAAAAPEASPGLCRLGVPAITPTMAFTTSPAPAPMTVIPRMITCS